MAVPSVDEILAVICPKILTVAGYNVYVDMATNRTASNYFGDRYNEAIALRAAHMYVLNTVRGGQAGVETYKMEGRLAISYGGTGVIRDELELTNYGMQLKALIRSCQAAVTTTSDYAQTQLGLL